MEIDLNLAVFDEMESNACGNGDLTSFSSCNSSYSSNASASAFPCSVLASSTSTLSSSSSIYVELWHACAGAITILHKKGDLVVYFPQGHLEQANALSFKPIEAPPFDVPPQILCRVVDVQLLANNENDEVYTQISLHPLQQMVGVELGVNKKENVGADNGGNREARPKSTSHMFLKTLTASDTSTHGGFSVPRRAAEDCFPPFDYKEQRPSQELIATDLHGVEWKFRHIYRGQPRRHLLTSGWSTFVSRKNLVSGDAVLFLRGESGDLRVGIRRATRPRNALPENPNALLSNVANALSSNGMFNVVYSSSWMASHSNFIVPYQKYLKCTASPVPFGTRFKMKYNLDDSPERRFNGVVTGTGDAKTYKWPNSKWRSLMVRWGSVIDHHERVSPWEIDYESCYTPPSFHPFPTLKKPRLSLHSSLSSGGGYEEYVRSYKVLQCQENSVSAPKRMVKMSRGPATFVESNWLPKVLQGQEICSFYPLASKGVRSLPLPSHKPIFRARRRVMETASAAPMHLKGTGNGKELVG